MRKSGFLLRELALPDNKWVKIGRITNLHQHHCHATLGELSAACKAFIHRINAEPEQLISRLWPKFELDPDYEKFLVST